MSIQRGPDGKPIATIPVDPTFVRPIDPARPFLGSIFDRSMIYTTWHVQIHVHDKIAAGTPGDPRIVEAWLANKLSATANENELRAMVIQTLIQLGYEVDEESLKKMSHDQLVEAVSKAAQTKNTVVFKRDPQSGIYTETRCVKAMLKECANNVFSQYRSLFPNMKGAKNFFAENVFVVGDRLYYGAQEPDDTELFVGHVSGPKGPQSNLTYYQIMRQPVIEFDLLIAKNDIIEPLMDAVWVTAEQNGLGSLRSQGYGRFDVEVWTKTKDAMLPDYLKAAQAAARAAKKPLAKKKANGQAAVDEGVLVAAGVVEDGFPTDEGGGA